MTTTPVSLDEAVARLVKLNQPVLFCDTCALLDIIRLPARASPDHATRTLSAATAILEDVNASRTCLVLPSLIRDEWTKNVQSVEDEAKEAFRRIQDGCDLASAIQYARGQNLRSTTIPGDDIVKYLRDLGTRILDASMELIDDPNTKLRATDRAALCTPPATKGGAIKDCLIYEHVVTVMRLARQAGHSGNLVFLTSNTRDFCESHQPKEPIKKEFTEAKATLCTDWGWASHELSSASASLPSPTAPGSGA